MKITIIEHSPFPVFESMKASHFIFNKSEIAALRRAEKIIDDAQAKIEKYFEAKDEEPNDYDLMDYDRELGMMFSSHLINDLLETHSETFGVKIENIN